MKDVFTPMQIEVLSQVFADLMSEVDKRLAEAIAAQPPAMHHAGTWKEGAFKGGALVTDKGSLWLAKRATTARPGQSDAWQLVVKNGRANGHAEPRKHVATGARR